MVFANATSLALLPGTGTADYMRANEAMFQTSFFSCDQDARCLRRLSVWQDAYPTWPIG